jgi:uncharacterized cupredoxin-like copper-binding protein
MQSRSFPLFLVAIALAGDTWAHGEKSPRKAPAAQSALEEKAFGRAGDPRKVSRTLRIDGADTMRFTPPEIRVTQGETVRLAVRNRGKLLHEAVLGTMAELKQHADLMKKFPEMEHEEPYMVHVKPGRTGEIVWQFTRPGEFYFACLIPGHFEAGMLGKVVVTERGERK